MKSIKFKIKRKVEEICEYPGKIEIEGIKIGEKEYTLKIENHDFNYGGGTLFFYFGTGTKENFKEKYSFVIDKEGIKYFERTKENEGKNNITEYLMKREGNLEWIKESECENKNLEKFVIEFD